MLAGGYIRVYQAVYGPEIIGGFGLKEKSRQKTKAVCGLGRTNYGGRAEYATRYNRPSISLTYKNSRVAST